MAAQRTTLMVPADKLRDLASGAVTLQTLLELSSDDLEVMAEIASEMLMGGQQADAWTIFEGLSVVAPDWYGGYAGMGAIALERDKPECAEFFLAKATALNCSDPAVYSSLGTARLRLGRPGAAAESLKKALALDPDGQALSTPYVRGLLDELALCASAV